MSKEKEDSLIPVEGARKLEELAEKLNHLRTMAATQALACSLDSTATNTFMQAEAIAHNAYTVLVMLSVEDILREGQLLIRSYLDVLDALLVSGKKELAPQVVAAGEELFSFPVVKTLNTILEDLNPGHKIDQRVAVLNAFDGSVHFAEDASTLQDGSVALAPLYAGSPTYVPSVESICFKNKDGNLSLCKEGEISQYVIDMKTKSLHLSLMTGIIMHMTDIDNISET